LVAIALALLSALFFTVTYVFNRAAAMDGGVALPADVADASADPLTGWCEARPACVARAAGRLAAMERYLFPTVLHAAQFCRRRRSIVAGGG
jgi:hypothetical protein